MFETVAAPKMQVGAKYRKNRRTYTCISVSENGRATMAGAAGMVFVEPSEYHQWEIVEWTSTQA